MTYQHKIRAQPCSSRRENLTWLNPSSPRRLCSTRHSFKVLHKTYCLKKWLWHFLWQFCPLEALWHEQDLECQQASATEPPHQHGLQLKQSVLLWEGFQSSKNAKKHKIQKEQWKGSSSQQVQTVTMGSQTGSVPTHCAIPGKCSSETPPWHTVSFLKPFANSHTTKKQKKLFWRAFVASALYLKNFLAPKHKTTVLLALNERSQATKKTPTKQQNLPTLPAESLLGQRWGLIT